jgi:hypothetical protein
MTQKLFLALACCLILILIPAPQVSAQTHQGNSLTWRDANGNLHYQDEDGNYMINSGTSNRSDIQSDFNRDTTVQREKPAEPQTQTQQNDNQLQRNDKQLQNQNTEQRTTETQKKTMNRQTTTDKTVRDNSVDSSVDNSDRAANNSDRDLPRTAGELPLVGLLGMLSLAGAGTARLIWNTRR